MGYCYDNRGRLVCDRCDKVGGVKKIRCPFGYCPPPAYCEQCATEKAAEFEPNYHRKYGCEERSLEMKLRDAKIARMEILGVPYRCSAKNTDDGRVHVLFALDAKRSKCVGYFMAPATYDAVKKDLASPADYCAVGELTPAPDTFYGGKVTKAC